MNSKRLFKIATPIFAVLAILAIVLVVRYGAGSRSSTAYKDGTYTAIGNGRNGPVKANVTISNGKIAKIDIVEEEESPGIADPAFSQIPDAIIKAQNTDVDAAAGATVTSNAIKDAVAAALLQASVAASSTPDTTGSGGTAVGIAGKSFSNGKSDIVIIGAGGAGLAAATEAASLGAKVIVLEKMGITGGNTLSATGGLNAAETRYQKEQGIEDTKKQFYDDTMKGGGNKNNPTLVRNLTDKAPETVDWLISLGADLTDVGKMAGSTNSRTHRPKGGAAVGPHLAKVLAESAAKAGAEIRLNNKVIDLVGDKNNYGPVGVVVENPDGTTYTIDTKAVIIATGGFGANPEMVTKYNPKLEGFGTTNHRGATGDAFAWVEKFNVDLVDIEQIQTHPTVIPTSGVMITEAVRGNGAIMVNRSGERFGNEMATRDVMSADILKQNGQTAYLLFDQGVRESLKAIEGYVKQGLLTQGDTVADLAKKLGVDANTLQATVNKYNTMQKSGNGDSDFGRKASEMPRDLATGPYYAVEVGPAIHHTMGGIKINKYAEVIATNDAVIPGLFACGEVTGGIHGGNRLGGNAVADICVYGKIAGDTAVEYLKKLK